MDDEGYTVSPIVHLAVMRRSVIRARRTHGLWAEVLTAMAMVGVRLGTDFHRWSHQDGYVLEAAYPGDRDDPHIQEFIRRVWGSYDVKLTPVEAYERAAERFTRLSPEIKMRYLRGVRPEADDGRVA